jgi:hypothetical protein
LSILPFVAVPTEGNGMGRLIDDWRERKGQEDTLLHEQLCAAVQAKRVEVFTDPRMLDFQGSPVHNAWDHLVPLIVLMTAALVILLATGVAIGIVAMTVCVFAHLLGNRYFVAWRLKTRTLAFLQLSAQHWQTVWQLGGVALVLKDVTNEAPCVAPKGDWRKFARRNLGGTPEPVMETAQIPAPDSAEPE